MNQKFLEGNEERQRLTNKTVYKTKTTIIHQNLLISTVTSVIFYRTKDTHRETNRLQSYTPNVAVFFNLMRCTRKEMETTSESDRGEQQNKQINRARERKRRQRNKKFKFFLEIYTIVFIVI